MDMQKLIQGLSDILGGKKQKGGDIAVDALEHMSIGAGPPSVALMVLNARARLSPGPIVVKRV